jgi:hypothetical protein
MRLAERWQLEWPLLIGAGVVVALARPASTPAPRQITPLESHGCIAHRAVAPPPTSTCPAFARARLHVDDEAVLTCLPGSFGERGYFLHAFYKTSEWWERSTIVSEDGERVLVSLVDEPSSLRIAQDGDRVGFRIVSPDQGPDQIWIASLRGEHAYMLTESPNGDSFIYSYSPMNGETTYDLELAAGKLVPAR